MYREAVTSTSTATSQTKRTKKPYIYGAQAVTQSPPYSTSPAILLLNDHIMIPLVIIYEIDPQMFSADIVLWTVTASSAASPHNQSHHQPSEE